MGDGTIKRVTEEQIIAVLKEQELGAKAADLRYGPEGFDQLCKVSGDKVAVALAVQATFSQLTVYAPAMDWAELLITETSMSRKENMTSLPTA